MTKYAVIELKGHQYKISEGQEIVVDSMGGAKVDPRIMLLVEEDKVKVGKPIVPSVKIKLKEVAILEKGNKVTVVKYKAKSRYRRKMGFRPQLTRLLVEKIG